MERYSPLRPLRSPFDGALLLFVVTLFSLGMGGCGDGEDVDYDEKNPPTTPISSGGDPVTGDWVVIHALSDPESLNLVVQNDAVASEIDSYIYETLTIVDPMTLETIPWLADSLSVVSEDRLSYEFRLRKDARFSDGKPVTGEDFIFYLKTIKNPHIMKAAPIRGYYTRVDSAMLIDGDPYRLRVVMAEPYAFGEQWAGGLYAYPKHIWDPEGRSDRLSFAELNAGDTAVNPVMVTLGSEKKRLSQVVADVVQDIHKNFDPRYLVGSGPYMMESHRAQDRVVLRRNPSYWNIDHPFGKNYPERQVWLTINDYNAALSALKAGEIDFMPRLDPVQYKYEKRRFAKNDIVPEEYDYPAYTYIGYNGANKEKPFLADPMVRNAFAHALDREQIIRNVYFGNAVTVQSPLYRKRPEYDTTLPMIPYDLAKARTLLEKAGWKDTDNDGMRDKVVNGKKVQMEFTIQLNSGNNQRKQMAIIFSEALKQIGVTANLSTLEWAVFLDNMDKHEFDAVIGGWAMEVTEGDMYQIWHAKSSELGGSNYTSYNNPRVNELIEAIRGEFDYEKRRSMYREIQRIIHEEQPYNFLISEKRVAGYHRRFRNAVFFPPRPCYNLGWWWVPRDEQKYGTPSSSIAAVE